MDSEIKPGDGFLDLNFAAGEQPETLTGVEEAEQAEAAIGKHDDGTDSGGGGLAETEKVTVEAEDTEADDDVVDEKSKDRSVRSSAKRKKGRRRKSAAVLDEHDSCCCPFQDENKTVFAVSDLVWGKVRSHPWWPAQIFDPFDASEMASNNRKKDHYLVAYFGDKTFAWCDDSQLKPFQKHFSQLANQNSMDVFLTAKNAALQEVSRRVDLGMACPCFRDEGYARLRDSKFENAGVREGTTNYAVDRSWIASSFDPLRLIGSIRALARSLNEGVDKLELVIFKSQLKAFYRSKGYSELPVFVVGAGLEDNIEASLSKFLDSASRKKSKSGDKGSSVGKEKLGSVSKEKISGKEVAGLLSSTSSDEVSMKRKSRDNGGSVNKGKQGSQSKNKRSGKEVADRPNQTSKLIGKQEQSPPSKLKKSGKRFFDPSPDTDSRKTKSVRRWSSVGTERHVVECGRKRKSVSKLIEESDHQGSDDDKGTSRSSHRKLEVEDFDVDDIGKGKEKKLDALGDFVSKSQTSSSRQQSKFGELMRRVAGQMTGSPPMLKPNGETVRRSSSKVTRRKRGSSAILKQKKSMRETNSVSNGNSSDEMRPAGTAVSEDEKSVSNGQDTEEQQMKKQKKQQQPDEQQISDMNSEGNSLNPSNRSSEFSTKDYLPSEAEPDTTFSVHKNEVISDVMCVDAHG
ncbi:uncharacterized protein LOC122008330 [Zingiber officinale]|uniref:PWWP domain-containing protein n=1 Tax=Zingiber officinale TaxID=94328 RepID=A0A8J5KR65_ZINOF|nr:uncharacterized protein LOC122008330 [Zingiber officinale]KAG6485885.1 hypothetical protein ZIOFF_054452 [Zingiber officinale]